MGEWEDWRGILRWRITQVFTPYAPRLLQASQMERNVLKSTLSSLPQTCLLADVPSSQELLPTGAINLSASTTRLVWRENEMDVEACLEGRACSEGRLLSAGGAQCAGNAFELPSFFPDHAPHCSPGSTIPRLASQAKSSQVVNPLGISLVLVPYVL